MNDRVGTAVEYVDERGVSHTALVTSDWGGGVNDFPAVNVVYVSSDETQTDQYGRQIVREASAVHESRQLAPGRFWRELG